MQDSVDSALVRRINVHDLCHVRGKPLAKRDHRNCDVLTLDGSILTELLFCQRYAFVAVRDDLRENCRGLLRLFLGLCLLN